MGGGQRSGLEGQVTRVFSPSIDHVSWLTALGAWLLASYGDIANVPVSRAPAPGSRHFWTVSGGANDAKLDKRSKKETRSFVREPTTVLAASMCGSVQ